jgi:hypothetical protein
MTTITREGILDWIAQCGSKIANQAEPSNYSFERRELAKQFVNPLRITRAAYRAIRDASDEDLIAVTKEQIDVLFKYVGCQSNFWNLLELAVNGEFDVPSEQYYWIIKNGFIKFHKDY